MSAEPHRLFSLQKPAKKKKQLENVSKPAKDKKEKKGKKAANKVIKKSGKTGSKVKRKVLKVKWLPLPGVQDGLLTPHTGA